MYGEFNPASVTLPHSPTTSILNHLAKVALIYLDDRPKPRMGLLEVKLDHETGRNKAYIFFNLKSVKTELKSFGDLSKLLTVNSKDDILVNASLIDATSKIPYVATEVWFKKDGSKKSVGAQALHTQEWK